MNVFDYTAFNNRNGASEMVHTYGMQPAGSPQALAAQLAHCVAKNGQPALDKLTSIHPDVDLFQGHLNNIKTGYQKDKESFMEKHFFNANGQSMKKEVEVRENKTESSKDLFIVGGLIVLGLAIIMRK